jgi:hypothetical protein
MQGIERGRQIFAFELCRVQYVVRRLLLSIRLINGGVQAVMRGLRCVQRCLPSLESIPRLFERGVAFGKTL